MGRLPHIKKTYLYNIKTALSVHPNCEFVLLNWNSQDGLDEWVQKHLRSYITQGIVIYLKTDAPSVFNQAWTKNITCKAARGEVVCTLDADNFITSNFIKRILAEYKTGSNHLLRCHGGPMAGRICMRRTSFLQLRGFDESLKGWGGEDADFVARFKKFFKTREVKLGNTKAMFSDSCCGRALKHKMVEHNGQKENSATSGANLSAQNYIVNKAEWGELPS